MEEELGGRRDRLLLSVRWALGNSLVRWTSGRRRKGGSLEMHICFTTDAFARRSVEKLQAGDVSSIRAEAQLLLRFFSPFGKRSPQRSFLP